MGYIGLLALIFASLVNATEITVPVLATKPKPIPQYKITIVSPEPDETFQNDTQDFSVIVSVKPDLEKEDSVAVYADGVQVGDAVNSTSLVIPPLERGSHTIQAKIIQPKGKGAESEVITIFQQRHSPLLPSKK